jgi:hypothetical protein
VSNGGQGELDGSNRRQPTGDHHREVLHQLAKVIASPALKDPEFIEQKVAGYPDKVGDCDRDEWPQKMAQQPDAAEIHRRNGTSDHAKPEKTMNSFLIQHGVISEKSL